MLESTAVSDALDALGLAGVIDGLKPLRTGQTMVGWARTIKVAATDEKGIPGLPSILDEIVPGEILVLEWNADAHISSFGDLAATHVMSRGGRGLITGGCVRDAAAIANTRFPVWSQGVTCRSGSGRVAWTDAPEGIHIGGANVHNKSLIIGDESGLCSIPPGSETEVIREAAGRIGLDQLFRLAMESGRSFRESMKLSGTL